MALLKKSKSSKDPSNLVKLQQRAAEQRSKLDAQLNKLFFHDTTGILPAEIDPSLAKLIYASWLLEKEAHRGAPPNSSADVCYICQEEGDWRNPLLDLKCSHRLHADCARMQLDSSKIEPGQSIRFHNARCGICREWLDHPLINVAVAPYVRCYGTIALLAKQQQEAEAIDQSRAALTSTREIVEKMIFFSCYQCHQPYYAGRVECDMGEMPVDPPERYLCEKCLNTKEQPNDCAVHGKAFIQYKCRWVCFF